MAVLMLRTVVTVQFPEAPVTENWAGRLVVVHCVRAVPAEDGASPVLVMVTPVETTSSGPMGLGGTLKDGIGFGPAASTGVVPVATPPIIIMSAARNATCFDVFIDALDFTFCFCVSRIKINEYSIKYCTH